MTSPFLQKAETGVKSAKMLLDAGDTDGACSRAYYAMYDAARACLSWAEVAPARGEFKTHHGLTSAFFQHLVKTGLFPIATGGAIQRAMALRQIADYEASPVPHSDAVKTISDAESFVSTAAALVASLYRPPSAF